MAISRLMAGAFREVWQENAAANFNGGGALISVTTGIQLRAATDLGRVRATLFLADVVGVPVVGNAAFTLSATNYLIVSFQNLAGAGNQATWRLEVERVHSVTQADDFVYAGFFAAIGTADGLGLALPIYTLSTLPVGVPTGTMVFVTDGAVSGLPIVWDGTRWIDCNGAPV